MNRLQTDQITARIPDDLRDEVESYKRVEGVADSDVVRRALRAFLSDAEIPRAESLFTGARRGSARRAGRVTECRAAANVTLRKGTQAYLVADAIVRAGDAGATTSEICECLSTLPVNGVARRVTDLLDAGYAIEQTDSKGAPIVRRTRHGADAIVWRLTPSGRARYREMTEAGA